jgi:DNA-directed RNA polymerase subunit M/transcription elongation factor TFIIS
MIDTAQTRSTGLRCPTCGNAELFYQVQEHAENLVDGNLNHLHLLFDETAFYECYECHTQIAPPEYS